MRQLLALTLLLALPIVAKMPPDEFRSRRASLRKALEGSGVVVLAGRVEGRDEIYRSDQEPNFFYLTGWSEPGARLIVTPTEEILFLPHHNLRVEHYQGKRSSAEDADVRAVTGFDTVLPLEKFETELDKALDANERVYGLAGQPITEKLKSYLSFRDVSDATPMIAKLRMKKSPAEIAAIQHATDVSLDAQRAAWKRIQPGMYEYQSSALLWDTYIASGCENVAYSPIVGSGPNSTVLHYSANQRRMDRGEVLVMDAAAECDSYTSDITRTIPVGGKFSPRELEIYNLVLGAQNAAIAAAKPGARLTGTMNNSLTKIAKDYMDSHGKDLHGEPLGKYFIHGIGHHVGLQVHDASLDVPLEPGMVVTIEPGIYIPEENIGVRIEDVILITEQGAKVLSAALAREPDQVEKAVAR